MSNLKWENSLSDGGESRSEEYEEYSYDDDGEGPAPPIPARTTAKDRFTSKISKGKTQLAKFTKPAPTDPKHVRECCNLEAGHVHILSGRTGAGKTKLIRELTYNNISKFDRIYVLCPTADSGANRESYNYVDEKYLFTGADVDEGLLKAIIDEQKKSKNLRSLLILDDTIPTISNKSKLFAEIATQSRHMGGGLTTILVLQHLKYTPPLCRDNCLVSFLLRQGANNIKASMELQDTYSNHYEWEKFIKKNTQNYQIVRSDGDDLKVFKLPAANRDFYISYARKAPNRRSYKHPKQ